MVLFQVRLIATVPFRCTHPTFTEPPNDTARRTLVLVAKVLQNLANGVMFGGKEEFMIPMNKFIEGNTENLRDYFENMVVVRAMQLPPGADIPEDDRAFSLDVLHRHLAAGAKKMEPIILNPQTAPAAQADHPERSSTFTAGNRETQRVISINQSTETTRLIESPPPTPISETAPSQPVFPTTPTVDAGPSAPVFPVQTLPQGTEGAGVGAPEAGPSDGKSGAELYAEMMDVLVKLGPPPEKQKKK